MTSPRFSAAHVTNVASDDGNGMYEVYELCEDGMPYELLYIAPDEDVAAIIAEAINEPFVWE